MVTLPKVGFLILGIFLSAAPAPLFSAQEETVDGPRTAQGYEISKDNFMEIPPDMKIRKIANNVITPEPDTIYMARKIEEQEKQIQALRSQVENFETRLKKLES